MSASISAAERISELYELSRENIEYPYMKIALIHIVQNE